MAQERIVQDTWGAVVNLPGQPQQILADLNRPWVDDNGVAFSVMGSVADANPVTAAQDLMNDMPLIIGANGHAMLLVELGYVVDVYGRYQIEEVGVIDPWPSNPRFRRLSAYEGWTTNFLARVRVV